MTDEVHFSLTIGRPKVDIENEHAVVNVTVAISTWLGRVGSTTYLQSTSFPVETSVIMSRTHGGGVIGRRSCSGSARKYEAQQLSAPYLQNHTFAHDGVAEQHGVWEALAAILCSPQTTYSYLHPFSTQERGNGSCIAG